MNKRLGLALLCSFLLGSGCGGGDVTITGHVALHADALRPADARTITHVMAVNPETAAPRRTIAQVGSDGSFSLSVEAGKPYVLVFIDSSAVGADMVVALFRAGTLDTVSPQLAGHFNIGEMKVDPKKKTATGGMSYDALLAALGLSASAAEYLGSIDDLSLRYANPDIDGDGVLDEEQGHEFALDFHVRSNLRHATAAGKNFTVDDITDKFLPLFGPDAAFPVFNLASIYVEYPASFDGASPVPAGGQATALQGGATYTATLADGSSAQAQSSFSSLRFGDTRGWGPDYDLERVTGLELPGSGGVPATLAYGLGGGKTLTFTNVVTRTRAALTSSGSLAIFIRLTTAGGHLAAVDYQWVKRASATSWTPATAEEIAVSIGSDGGYVSFHLLPSWSNEVGVAIPAQPSGTVAWTGPTTAPGDICGLAVSYDDKLGLRHFIGGADPNPGVTCSP